MFYPRNISPHLERLFKQYPILTITGPRQSGKTTLCRKLFSNLAYVSLEDITNRTFAQQDPRNFLNQYKQGAIFDEIQRVPDLISYIQTYVDDSNKNGQFVLTGSRQFELMEAINQSLAGRTAIAKLLPLSLNEIYHDKKIPQLEEVLYTGFYPRIFAESLNPTEMYSFYTNTYLERDVRQILNIQNLKSFENFLKICAGRNGQIVNYSAIGSDCGLDQKTVKQWLSILEASYIIKLVTPYYKNLNMRVIKSPKLFFYDSGLVCYLLGIRKSDELINHPLIGAIFESFVFGEIFKYQANNILTDNIYFFRDNRGREVDCIFDKVTSISQLEIKRGTTVNSSFFGGINYLASLKIMIKNSFLVYGGDESTIRQDARIYSWKNLNQLGDFEVKGE